MPADVRKIPSAGLLRPAPFYRALSSRHKENKMTLWVTADTHFGDFEVLGAGGNGTKTARAFRSLEDMNACIADNWNDRISDQDVVYHLGDVFSGEGWQMLARLKGRKHLILGNHDNPGSPHLTAVFASISLWKTFADSKTVLTHLPLDLSERSGLGLRFERNIHGHLHHRPAPTPRHICTSVEQTAYKPVNLEDLMRDRQDRPRQPPAPEAPRS